MRRPVPLHMKCTTTLLSLEIFIPRRSQKWNVSSEQAIILSPVKNKNMPVKLNDSHHGNTSTCI